MNAIILYGSRYGASQTYAQALEPEPASPPWPTKRSRTLAPLTPSSTSAASMPVRPQGWPKPSATSPQTIPSAYWWLRWACPTPPWRTTSCASGSPWPRNSPPHLRAHHPCPPPRAIDYSVLTTRHRLMMKGLCTLLRRQPAEDRSPDTQALLDSYGKAVDFIDLDTLAPIQTWLEKG